jgi:hypothetical protein
MLMPMWGLNKFWHFFLVLFLSINTKNSDFAAAQTSDCPTVAVPKSDAIASSSSSSSFSIFSYQTNNIDWYENSRDLWDWLLGQKAKSVVTFCKWDTKIVIDDDNNENSFNSVVGPNKCPDHGTFTKFDGALDKNRLPKVGFLN